MTCCPRAHARRARAHTRTHVLSKDRVRVRVSKNLAASRCAPACAQVRDLLSKDPKNKLELKEDPDRGVYVKDLTFYVVKA